MPKKLKTFLVIAGSDPTGGAGIQADIRTGAALGLHVLTALTAVTVQNSFGVQDIGALPPDLLRQQLIAIFQEVTPDAIKIGMLASKDNAFVIKEFLEETAPAIPLVIDPIRFASSDGANLISGIFEDKDFAQLYVDDLFPLATVVTPNLKEIDWLLANKKYDINNPKSLPSLLHTKAVIIKGGHSSDSCIEDILIKEDGKILRDSHKKVESENLHGTGCVFSSLLAACLALGLSLENAFYFTSIKITNIISRSVNYKLGNSSYGPLNINNYLL